MVILKILCLLPSRTVLFPITRQTTPSGKAPNPSRPPIPSRPIQHHQPNSAPPSSASSSTTNMETSLAIQLRHPAQRQPLPLPLPSVSATSQSWLTHRHTHLQNHPQSPVGEFDSSLLTLSFQISKLHSHDSSTKHHR
jgi:hypothetical protein